jgi:hypothetical protein
MFLTLVSAGMAHRLNASVSKTPEKNINTKEIISKSEMHNLLKDKKLVNWLLQLRRDLTGLKEIFELVH